MIAEGVGDLLTIESSNVVTEWLVVTLLDMIKVSRELLKLLATSKLLYEGVREFSEGGDEIVR